MDEAYRALEEEFCGQMADAEIARHEGRTEDLAGLLWHAGRVRSKMAWRRGDAGDRMAAAEGWLEAAACWIDALEAGLDPARSDAARFALEMARLAAGRGWFPPHLAAWLGDLEARLAATDQTTITQILPG